MEKTAYPAWKMVLWLICTFLYTVAAIPLSLAIVMAVAAHIQIYIPYGNMCPPALLVLLLAGFFWRATRHRGLAIPTLLVEIGTVALVVLWFYSLPAYYSPPGGP